MRMIKLILFIGIICCIACTDNTRFPFSIKGNIDGIRYGKAFLLTAGENRKVLFETEIEEGKFDLSGVLDEPGRYVLKVNRMLFNFFLDGHKMNIHCPYRELSNKYLTGSPANDLEAVYNKLLRENFYLQQNKLMEEYKQAYAAEETELMDTKLSEVLGLEKKRFELTRDFVKEHPDNIYSAYISDIVKGDSHEKGKELYDLLSDGNKARYFGRLLKEHTDALAVSALGYPCPDFTVSDETGKQITLNSQKGNILVLDFWASWCGPCRAEMKNLRAQYEEFKERGVHFMSVSLDDSVEKWKEACREEQIPWLSARDDKGWKNSEIRELFGIQAIPFIVLLDKEGKIVAKNVRRNHLREKIIELLQKGEQ